MVGFCSHCKEVCTVVYDDCGPVSDCCSAPLVEEGSRFDETETPGGRLPYEGGEQRPDLDLYEIELSDGTIFRPHATSATNAMQQAEQAWPELMILSCREVAAGA